MSLTQQMARDWRRARPSAPYLAPWDGRCYSPIRALGGAHGGQAAVRRAPSSGGPGRPAGAGTGGRQDRHLGRGEGPDGRRGGRGHRHPLRAPPGVPERPHARQGLHGPGPRLQREGPVERPQPPQGPVGDGHHQEPRAPVGLHAEGVRGAQDRALRLRHAHPLRGVGGRQAPVQAERHHAPHRAGDGPLDADVLPEGPGAHLGPLPHHGTARLGKAHHRLRLDPRHPAARHARHGLRPRGEVRGAGHDPGQGRRPERVSPTPRSSSRS